ncbi:hypothetical protein ACFQU7_05525 [Pseudoroseomonas wenyumeiae]
MLWALMALSKVLQMGGVVGGTALALSILLPLGGDPLGGISLTIWTAVVSLAASRCSTVTAMAASSVVPASLWCSSPSSPSASRWACPSPLCLFHGGHRQRLVARHSGGCDRCCGRHVRDHRRGRGRADLLYLLVHRKGYARHVGPNDGSEAWRRRAKGWISVMYKDAFLSWLIYTFGTIAFFIMGAAVLNPQGIVPQGNEMITALSRMYTDTLGEWAGLLFLVGAVVVLGSTLWAAVPSWSRMYVNLLAELGVLRWQDTAARLRWIASSPSHCL